jgi:hypothetical protein
LTFGISVLHDGFEQFLDRGAGEGLGQLGPADQMHWVAVRDAQSGSDFRGEPSLTHMSGRLVGGHTDRLR